MNVFFANLVNRHLGACDTIQPRMRGRFEADPVSEAEALPTEDETSYEAEAEAEKQQAIKPSREAADELVGKRDHEPNPYGNNKRYSSPSLPEQGNASTQRGSSKQQPAQSDSHVFSEKADDMQLSGAGRYSTQVALRQEQTHKASQAAGEHDILGDERSPVIINKPLEVKRDKTSSPAPPAGARYPLNERNHHIPVVHQRLAGDHDRLRTENQIPDPFEKGSPLLDAAITPLIVDPESDRQADRKEGTPYGERDNEHRDGRLETPSWLPDIGPQFNQRPQASETKAEPVINVTIGRIEVRAIKPETTKNISRPTTPSGVMTLDEYLKQREGEEAR